MVAVKCNPLGPQRAYGYVGGKTRQGKRQKRARDFSSKGWIKQVGIGRSAKGSDKSENVRHWMQIVKWELCRQESMQE